MAGVQYLQPSPWSEPRRVALPVTAMRSVSLFGAGA